MEQPDALLPTLGGQTALNLAHVLLQTGPGATDGTAAQGRVYGEMNTIISPFLIVLILLLGICVPKRLLLGNWLFRFTPLLAAVTLTVSFFQGIKIGLVVVLVSSLILQCIVLIMVVTGSERLNFTRKGYWVRTGSSLLHMGMILFVLDLFFYRHQSLHLILFWVTTGTTVLGMTPCFLC